MLDDFFSIITLLDSVIDQLIKDNALLIQRMLFAEGEAADKAEDYLKKYGGFTFRYNVGILGVSIEISSPPVHRNTPFDTIPPYDKPPFDGRPPSRGPIAPPYDPSSREPIIPAYDPLPYTTYTVKSGDSFWKIAEEQMGSGARYEELAKYNGLTSSSVIHPGNVLKIPR